MEEQQNLKELSEEISSKLLDSMRLIEILSELNDGEAKQETLLDIIRKNTTCAFKNTETIRKMISHAE